MKTESGGSIMQTDISLSRSLSLSLCRSLSRSRSLSLSRASLSLIAGSRSLSFSPLLSRTLSRSRSRFLSRLRSRSWSLSHAVSPNGGKDGDAAKEKHISSVYPCLLRCRQKMSVTITIITLSRTRLLYDKLDNYTEHEWKRCTRKRWGTGKDAAIIPIWNKTRWSDQSARWMKHEIRRM